MILNKQKLLAFGVLALAVSGLSAQTPPPAPPAPSAPALFQIAGGGNYLGVVAEDVDKEEAQRLSLREQRGVIVKEVRENSPAAKAGLQKDDVILRFEGEAITSMRKLMRLIEESAPEQKVRMTILRNGQEREIEATLAARRAEWNNFERMPGFQGLEWKSQGLHNLRGQLGALRGQVGGLKAGQAPLVFFGGHRRIGVGTSELTEQLGEFFGVSGKSGLLINSVEKDSPADKAGLKAGDVIIEANGAKISDAGDLIEAVNKQEEGDVTLTIIRNKTQQSVKVTPEKSKQPRFQGLAAPRIMNGLTLPDQE